MKKMWSLGLVLASLVGLAQDKEERIERDVEVAENVLSTLIKQQLDKKSSFWPLDVDGNYTPGFGVTLRIPYENFPMAFTLVTENFEGPSWNNGGDAMIGINGNTIVERRVYKDEEDKENKEKYKSDKEKLKIKISEQDSVRASYSNKLLEASKIFLADYGDLIGLEPNERILITSKSEGGDRHHRFVFPGGEFSMPKRKVISVEALKSDLTQYKQNKISRDQLISKFKVVNSELNEEVQPDLELLITIFNRLYSPDLSKTFFMEGPPYYERMKDFGVTYFMQVYSSNINHDRFSMPTLDLDDLDQAERDKKVKELYPIFEKEIKANMLEYGRTITSLNDNELLIFDITLTKCKGCGIPATVELSVKASVLKEFGSGKISKEAAVSKVNVKKGAVQ